MHICIQPFTLFHETHFFACAMVSQIILHKINYTAPIEEMSLERIFIWCVGAILTTWTKIYCTGTQIPINPSLRSQIYSDNFCSEFFFIHKNKPLRGEVNIAEWQKIDSTLGALIQVWCFSIIQQLLLLYFELDFFAQLLKQFSHRSWRLLGLSGFWLASHNNFSMDIRNFLAGTKFRTVLVRKNSHT